MDLPPIEKPFWVLNAVSGMKMSDHETKELAVANADQLLDVHQQSYVVVNVVPLYIATPSE